MRLEVLRAELEAEQGAMKEVLNELSSLPVLIATAEESPEAGRFRKEVEPPRALEPTIRKPQQRPQRQPKPLPSSPGASRRSPWWKSCRMTVSRAPATQ